MWGSDGPRSNTWPTPGLCAPPQLLVCCASLFVLLDHFTFDDIAVARQCPDLTHDPGDGHGVVVGDPVDSDFAPTLTLDRDLGGRLLLAELVTVQSRQVPGGGLPVGDGMSPYVVQ